MISGSFSKGSRMAIKIEANNLPSWSESGRFPRVYMAGPDVFYHDRDARFQRLAQLCSERGLHAVLPLDSQPLPQGLADPELSAWIAVQNRDVIRGRTNPPLPRCDAVVANLQPFRGLWADTGTCVEIGIAAGLDTPVFTYGADTRAYPQKLEDGGQVLAYDEDGLLRDHEGILVENLGQPENSMIHGLSEDFTTCEQALDAVANRLKTTR